VPHGTAARFLAPETVTLLPDLDPRIRGRLDDYQLDLIGEIQAIPEPSLRAVFGAAGELLSRHAHGIDPRPVLPPAVKAEFGRCTPWGPTPTISPCCNGFLGI
jgi:nucleotidyltransferase/DNA polymerase involved in DNA repair